MLTRWKGIEHQYELIRSIEADGCTIFNPHVVTIEDGGKVQQATVLFDPDSGETRMMRSKEDAHDYRYFPDPDLLPVRISDEQIARIRGEMPELPGQMKPPETARES